MRRPLYAAWSQTLPGGGPTATVEHLGERDAARAATFLDAGARDRFLTGRVLLRSLLGRLQGVPAASVTLVVEPGGRVVTDGGWCVSLSHTGPVVVVVAARRPVGVDVEAVPSVVDPDLAAATLTARDHAAWRGLPAPDRPAAFVRSWTRAEAALKAHGRGLPPTPVETAGRRVLGARVRDLPAPPHHLAAVALL